MIREKLLRAIEPQMVRDAIGLGDRIVTHSEMLQNDDGIPRARQVLRTVPLGNLSMTRHGGGFPGLSIDVKAMLSSFAHELAALTLKMSN